MSHWKKNILEENKIVAYKVVALKRKDKVKDKSEFNKGVYFSDSNKQVKKIKTNVMAQKRMAEIWDKLKL